MEHVAAGGRGVHRSGDNDVSGQISIHCVDGFRASVLVGTAALYRGRVGAEEGDYRRCGVDLAFGKAFAFIFALAFDGAFPLTFGGLRRQCAEAGRREQFSFVRAVNRLTGERGRSCEAFGKR